MLCRCGRAAHRLARSKIAIRSGKVAIDVRKGKYGKQVRYTLRNLSQQESSLECHAIRSLAAVVYITQNNHADLLIEADASHCRNLSLSLIFTAILLGGSILQNYHPERIVIINIEKESVKNNRDVTDHSEVTAVLDSFVDHRLIVPQLFFLSHC